jgi:ankyrin repeat protein
MNNRESYHDRKDKNRKGEFSFETRFEFKRAIMLDIMEDPVIASDDSTYERVAMEQWLAGGRRIGPMPRARLAHRFSAYNDHLANVQWLLQNGATVTEKNKKGSTALLLAASNGYLATVEWLLQNGATLAEKDRHGDTALLLAANNGKLSTVQWLLQNGETLNQTNKIGATVLLKAASHGHLEIVQWLLQHGVTLTEKDRHGNTALLLAASNGHLETVQWLSQHGACLDEKNKNGNTALFLAALKGHLATVQWLLSEGRGNIHDENKAGKTVFDLAKKDEINNFLKGFRMSEVHGRLFQPANISGGEQAIFRENEAHHKDEQKDDPLLVVGQKRKKTSSEPIHPMLDSGDNSKSTRISMSRMI